jgi:uncharacterized OsmC-like protein
VKQFESTDGIDVDRLKGIVDAIKTEPSLASFRFHARNKWVCGSHTFSEIKQFEAAGETDTKRSYRFVFHADEPDALLGTDYGPSPGETVLHALAACVTSALIFNAAMQNVKINSLEFDVEGEVDARGFLAISPDIRRGFNTIRMTCRISGDAPDEKLRELVELGQRYSPVFDIVTNGVPVTVQIEGQEAKAAI